MGFSIRFQDYFANATQLSLHPNVPVWTQQGPLSKLEQVCANHPQHFLWMFQTAFIPAFIQQTTWMEQAWFFGLVALFLSFSCGTDGFQSWWPTCTLEMWRAEPYEGRIIHLRGLSPATPPLAHPWLTGLRTGGPSGAAQSWKGLQVFILSSA